MYLTTYVRQNVGVRDILGQIPKSMCQALYLLPSDFPKNFSKAFSHLNIMKDC